jgi:hypothetical protein
MKERFCENRLRGCSRMFLSFTYKLRKKQGGGACVTPQNDTVEDGLTERASESNLGGKEANLILSCNPSNVGKNG